MNETILLKGVTFYGLPDGSYIRHSRTRLDSRIQTSQSEQTLCDESLEKNKVSKRKKRRFLVRISQFTRRRQDPDNCMPKYEIDALREIGLLSDDTDDDIELSIQQIQVFKKEDEGVLIEIL